MKRDSIFYKLFRQAPQIIFELLPQVPENAAQYRFDSVAVKEPRFEIDGVFLPPEGTIGAVFFVEVQFQHDPLLYERIFAETALYYYRNAQKFSDWQVVVIYPSRATEQRNLYPHRGFLHSGQVHRIYLNELGDLENLPLWVALMVLTTIDAQAAPVEGRLLINRAQQEVFDEERRAIIEMVTTIISYQFKQLSISQVEAMLDITFEETRVYQELKAKAEQQGMQKGMQEGMQKGRQEEAVSLIVKLLTKRFGSLPETVESNLTRLSLPLLEELSTDILDFSELKDLTNWLENHASS